MCFIIISKQIIWRGLLEVGCMASVYTWEMHPPSPVPSKNWWKLSAATRGFIVLALSEAPKDIPMITEWITIPNSKTCLMQRM